MKPVAKITELILGKLFTAQTPFVVVCAKEFGLSSALFAAQLAAILKDGFIELQPEESDKLLEVGDFISDRVVNFFVDKIMDENATVSIALTLKGLNELLAIKKRTKVLAVSPPQATAALDSQE